MGFGHDVVLMSQIGFWMQLCDCDLCELSSLNGSILGFIEL